MKNDEVKIKNNKTKEEELVSVDYLLYFLDEHLSDEELEDIEGLHECSCGCHKDNCECDDDCDCGCHDGEECTCGDDCDCGCHEKEE